MEIGDRLKQLIESKGITAYSLSDETNLSQSTLSRIINKNSKPNASNLKVITEYFGVSREWFLTGKDDSSGNSQVNEPSDSYAFTKKEKGTPIYDVSLTAGFMELFKDSRPSLLGFLDTMEVKGCDMIVGVTGDSMEGLIDSGDWIGIKRVTDMDVINYGNPYGIVTTDMQMLKFIFKSSEKDSFLLKSENPNHPDFDIPKSKILELYIIKVVLPFSKIKTFI